MKGREMEHKITKGELKQLFFVISTIQPKATFPTDPKLFDMVAETWLSFIGDYSLEMLKPAVKKYFMGNRNPPGPNDILDELKKFMPDDPNKVVTAEMAWGEVMQLINVVGHYKHPDETNCQNPALIETIKNMGWKEICTNENIEATRAHFMKIYRAYMMRHNDAVDVERLGGKFNETILISAGLADRFGINKKKPAETPKPTAPIQMISYDSPRFEEPKLTPEEIAAEEKYQFEERKRKWINDEIRRKTFEDAERKINVIVEEVIAEAQTKFGEAEKMPSPFKIIETVNQTN